MRMMVSRGHAAWSTPRSDQRVMRPRASRTGKARPSPTMVGQLSAALAVPLRERLMLFSEAGFFTDTSELPLGAPVEVEVIVEVA